MEDIMYSIEVDNLTKIYKTYEKRPGLMASFKTLFSKNEIFCTALKNVSFKIDEGEIIGIIGPNGAGKTTAMKVLSGIIYPTEGQVTVSGHIPWEREINFKKKISMIAGNKSQLMWDLTAMDSFLWLKEIYEVPKDDFYRIINELSSAFYIKNKINTQLRRLSFGERMKMELIACILHSPQVFFMDEPTIGLDVLSQNNIHSFIKEYNQKTGATILITSHNMADIEKLCKRVIIFMQGEVLYDGKIKDLISNYFTFKKVFVKIDSDNLDLNEFGPEVHLIDKQENNYHLKVPREIYKNVANIIWSKYSILDFNIQEPGLTEVIEQLFANSRR